LNVQIKKAKKRSQARRKRKANQKEPTLLGMKMMSLHQAPHQVKMKKPICVLWPRESSCTSLNAENYNQLL